MEVEAKARLGYWIEAAREATGMSRHELAEVLGVTYTTVYTWETGRKTPSLLMLGPLCDALGVSAELFRDLPDEPPSPVAKYSSARLDVIRAEREANRQAMREAKSSSASKER